MVRNTAILALLVAAPTAWAQTAQPGEETYRQLESRVVWVHPKLTDRLNAGAVEEQASRLAPFQLKVVVVPELGPTWTSGATERRGAFAKWLANDRLKLDRAIAIVVTRKGISAYCGEVAPKTLQALSDEAAKVGDPDNVTPAVLKLADSVHRAALGATAATQTPVAGAQADVGRDGPLPALTGIGLVLLGGGAVYWAWRSGRLRSAKRRTLAFKDQAVNAIAYLDSYADLLPNGSHLDALRSARDEAERHYSEGLTIVEQAKTPGELDAATLAFGRAAEASLKGRQAVDDATGGTKTAFLVDPPELAGLDDPRIYQPVKSVCYFCSRPGRGDLTPVTVNVDGRRQTVLVCPDDLSDVRAGREPSLRGTTQRGRFVPWYGVAGYDPATMYGSGNFVWDMLAVSALSSALSPHHGHHRHDGVDAWVPAADPSGPSSGWGGDWSTFESESGGGDWGGGDFSGGDWGGGGDSGGGDGGGGGGD